MIVERIFTIEKVGLGNGKCSCIQAKQKPVTNLQLTDVFTEVEVRLYCM